MLAQFWPCTAVQLQLRSKCPTASLLPVMLAVRQQQQPMQEQEYLQLQLEHSIMRLMTV